MFLGLVNKGEELLNFHLFLNPSLSRIDFPFEGWAENTVTRSYPIFSDSSVWINPQQVFKNITDDIWNFEIGGYQVCEKWLKDRRGLQLTNDDIRNYQKILTVIRETIRIMGEIDEVIEEHGGWPIQ